MKKSLLLCAVVLVAGALPATAAPLLGKQWFEVQKALNAKNIDALRAGVAGVEKRAHVLGVRHLGPYARALAAWAAHEPGQIGDVAAGLARQLDPGEPSVWFVVARKAWDNRSYGKAVTAFVRGLIEAVKNDLSRRQIVESLVPFLLMTLGFTLFFGTVLISAQFLPRIYHDARELGALLFKGADAAVFGVVVVVLPLFAGLGPVWLVAYVFGLTFAYLEWRQRFTVAVVWLLLVSIMPAFFVWERSGLREMPLAERAASALKEKRLDPSMMQELVDLEPKLKKSPEYHLVLGALLRLHDDAVRAKSEFQKAAVEAPGDPRPLIFFGNVAFHEANLPQAIQSYSLAIKRNPAVALTYYDLSLALDQSYRFQEADKMMRKARQLGGKELERMIDGAGSVPLDPPFRANDFIELAREISRSSGNRGGMPSGKLWSWTWLFSSLSLVFVATGIVGVVLAVIRKRWMWTARACTRCGKIFCPRCHEASESEAYCSQCVSVFLKRSQVAIEQQAQKLDQIRRRNRRVTWTRRAVSFILPGGGILLQGRWERGLVWGLIAMLSGVLAFGWLPQVLSEIEPLCSTAPLQVLAVLVLVLSWLHTIRLSWGDV